MLFEDTNRYLDKNIQNRFTVEMLDEYLKQFNIFAFQEDFYLPSEDNIATLIEHKNFGKGQTKEFSLEEVRHLYDLD